MTLGQRIQELRKQKELSQEGLGEKLGVSRQAVSRWEMDGAVPEVDKLIAMSRIFGVSLNDLLQVEEGAAGSQPKVVLGFPRPWRVGVLVLALVCALSLGGNLWLGLRTGALKEQLAAAEEQLAATEESLDPDQPLVVGFDVEYYLMRRDEALICYTFTVTAARQAEGMELELQAVDENGEVYTLPMEWVQGSVCRGELEMRYPAGGNAAVSALVRDELGRSYTQPVAELVGMGGENETVKPLW